MSSAGGFIASILVNTVWQIPLIAGAGWLAARVLRRLGPQAEHSISVVTLMAAILTPVLQPLWRLVVALNLQPAVQSYPSMAPAIAQNAGPSGHSVYMLPAAVLWILFALYLGSVVYFGARLARSLRFTNELLDKAVPVALTQEQRDLWDQCKRSIFSEHGSHSQCATACGPGCFGTTQTSIAAAGRLSAEVLASGFSCGAGA